MAPRLPQGPRDGNCEQAGDTKRRLWGRALSDALYGHCPAVAEESGISQRMLEHYIAPFGEVESPFEKVGAILDGLRAIGRGAEATGLLGMLADEQGFDLAARVPLGEISVGSVAEQAVDAGREFAEAAAAACAAAKTGRLEEFRKQIGEAIRAAHALSATVCGDERP